MTNMNTLEQTLPDLLNELGVTLKIRHKEHPANANAWQLKMNCYRVTLSYQERFYSLYFYQGTAIKQEPSVADVIHCLSSDLNILSSCDSLKCFGECFGWDENTANTYRTIKRQSARYSKLIGDPATLEAIASKEY